MRLEQGGTTTQRFLKEFQFHKGAIRTSKPPIIASLQQDFNSIKVRLELSGIAGAVSPIVFQFHKGAIRTHIPYLERVGNWISIP